VRRTCKRLEEKDDLRTQDGVRSKKTSEIKWNFIVFGLESERGKLRFDAPLKWQPVEFFQRHWCPYYNTTGAETIVFSWLKMH